MRYFMELAKCLNFTRAAANLYVAQPTLSQQIAELEAQLGVTLFVRSSRSVTLTPAGAMLYNAYPGIVAQVQQLREHMLVTAAGFRGSLSVGFLDGFIEFLPLLMRDFKNAFPDIVIKPVCATLNELINGLKNHTIDVAFSLIQDYVLEECPSFQTKFMATDALCFVLPPEYPAPADYSFAESLPLVIYGESNDFHYRDHVTTILKNLGIRVSNVILTESTANIRAYLESGAGFSVLAEKNTSYFSPSTRFIPIPDCHVSFGAVWNSESGNPALPLFLDALDQFLENNAGLDLTALPQP